TAWMTVKRHGEVDMFDWGLLLFGITVFAAQATFAVRALMSPTKTLYGLPAPPYIMLGSVVLLAVIGDIRMLMRGGIAGTQRIARHLWRMCFGWFVASGSIFLARPHLFPVWMRKSGALYFLTVLPLLLLVFWMVRVRAGSVSP